MITGQYCEANCDFSLDGLMPLQLHRVFSTETLGHWQFNHPNIFQNTPVISDGILMPRSLALYEYDKYQRLSAIQHTSHNGEMPFHKITFEYNLSSTAPKCTINLPNSPPIVYHYKSAGRWQNMPPYILEKVVGADQYITEYDYIDDANHQRKLIISKKEPNNHYINSSYDPLGRVVCQWAPLGTDTTPIFKHRFTYHEGYTVVEDALNRKIIYRYSENHLTAIEHYDQDEAIRTELFHWEIIGDTPRMVSKAIKDKTGQILFCKTFCYDLQGHVIEETLYGNLTGTHEAEIKLDAKGFPLQNGVEHYTTYFQYDSSFPYHLLSKAEDNGNKTRYSYLHNTSLVSAKLDSKTRHFFTYDQNLLLSKKIIDDGTAEKEGDLTNVTVRQITYYSYCFDKTLQKYSESIEEKELNLTNGDEQLIQRTLNEYSEQGKLIAQKIYNSLEKLSTSYNYCYDVTGKLLSVSDKEGNSTHYAYDANRNLQSTLISNSKGETQSTTNLYDYANRIIHKEEKRNNHPLLVFTNSYDYAGQLIAETDACGNKILHEYDVLGNRIKTIYPEVLDAEDRPYAPRIIKEYNILGHLVRTTDANQGVTELQYNARGKPIYISFPDGSFEKYEYALDGSLLKTVKRDLTSCLYEYDSLGQVSKIIALDRAGKIYNTTCSEEKSLKTILSDFQKAAQNKKTDNEEGEIQKEEPELQEDLHYNYDYLNPYGQKGLQTRSTDKLGFSTLTTLDALQRVEQIRKIDPWGKIITQQEMRYDGNGNKIRETHYAFQNNQVVKTFTLLWEYDKNNRPIKMTEAAQTPLQNITYYSYHLSGKLSTLTKPDGTTLTYLYDDANQLAAFFGSDDNFYYVYTYDEAHRLIAVGDLTKKHLTTRTYNDQGQLLAEKLGNDLTLTYERDSLGRPVALILPDSSKVIYEYKDKNLTSIRRENAKGEEIYSHSILEYNSLGQITHEKMIGNLGDICFEYDQEGRILHQQSSQFSQKIQYDKRHNVSEITTHDSSGDRVQSYCYDEREQLSHEQTTGAHDEDSSYTYDSFFNRTSKNGTAYINNENHQLIQAGSTRYVYDANQCLVKKIWSDSEGLSHEMIYTYDSLNRLLQVQADTLTLQYNYDAFGRCLSKIRKQNDHIQTIRYLFDGNKEIGAAAEDGSLLELRILNPVYTTEHHAAIALEVNNQLYVPLHDIQGSICLLIQADTGEVVENYRYTAFGEIYQKLDNNLLSPWLFSGKRFDADIGLILFGARNYDPSIGRWITPDSLKQIDGFNPYAYLVNNPLTMYDMWGHFSISGIWGDFVQELKIFWDTIISLKSFSLKRNFRQEMGAVMEPLFGKLFLLMHGFYEENECVGVYGKGEIHDKIRITALNGLLNLNEHWLDSVKLISQLHGNTNVHYILDPTKGWTGDTIKGFLAKCGYVLPATKLLAQTWKSLISDIGGIHGGGLIMHFAHSIGGTNTVIARDLLSPEEQKMIKVITIASATIVPNKGFESVVNYISGCDFIGVMDPFSYINSFFNRTNVVHLESVSGIPMLDHVLSSQTYMRLLETLGHDFLESYGLISL